MYGGGGIEPDHRLEGPIEGFNPGRFGRMLYARQVFASFAQKFSAVGDTRIAVDGAATASSWRRTSRWMRRCSRRSASTSRRKASPIDEAAFAQDLAFITAMIRYEIDLNLWTVEDARRHLIATDPQAQLALDLFAGGGAAGPGGPGRGRRAATTSSATPGPAGAAGIMAF